MIDFLIQLDQQFFILINQTISNAYFDYIMPVIRNKYLWAPLYLFLFSYLLINLQKKGVVIIVFFLLTVLLCDQLSSQIIKPVFERLRPCNNLTFAPNMNLLITCGSGYSFVSSHAANHFGMAVFTGLIFCRIRWVFTVSVIWAALISFAQVYVGVHYPLDVIGGAIIGILTGAFIYLFYKKMIVIIKV